MEFTLIYKGGVLTPRSDGSHRNMVCAQCASIEIKLPFQSLSDCIFVYWIGSLSDAFLELPTNAELHHHTAGTVKGKSHFHKHTSAV
jgi:hypothetical protein